MRDLKNELFITRYAMLVLMPPPLESVLRAALGLKTFEAVAEWKLQAADEIVAIASNASENVVRLDWVEQREVCPLCSQGPDSPYHDGFFLPEGLRRHLLGTHRVHQCPVFIAAEQMALDELREGSLTWANWSNA